MEEMRSMVKDAKGLYSAPSYAFETNIWKKTLLPGRSDHVICSDTYLAQVAEGKRIHVISHVLTNLT